MRTKRAIWQLIGLSLFALFSFVTQVFAEDMPPSYGPAVVEVKALLARASKVGLATKPYELTVAGIEKSAADGAPGGAKSLMKLLETMTANLKKQLLVLEPAASETDKKRRGPHAPAMVAMQSKIKKNWFPPKSREQYAMIIGFDLNTKTGTAENIKIVHGSGNQLMDRSLVEAIKRASPFSTPSSLHNAVQRIGIQFQFNYNPPAYSK